MEITDKTIVLASLTPPSIWDFYGSVEYALAKQDEANEYEMRLEKHGAAKCHYQPMTFAEYNYAERDYYLSPSAVEVTAEKFHEMLNCLPPMAWRRDGTFESFLMSEFWTASYTHQYARHGKRYYQKMVDASDKATWMSATTVAA